MGERASLSPLTSLIVRGNPHELRPSSGPLGKTYYESQYGGMASNSMSLPAPIPIIKCLADQA